MAMKFKTEQKGQTFIVFNETTGDVKGHFKTKGEADVYRETLQKRHEEGVSRIQPRQDSQAVINSEEEGD